MEDRPRRPRTGLPPSGPPRMPRALARVQQELAREARDALGAIPEQGVADADGDEREGNAAGSSDDLFPPGRDLILDASPRDWREVFDDRSFVTVGDDTFCCYSSSLHTSDVVCVLLHGGGHCALSWGMVAELLRKSCGVLAFDSRAHGDSKCQDEDDLSTEVQVADAAAVVREVFRCLGRDVPSIILVGHSMGGAVAVRLAASKLLDDAVAGLVVIDIVEGTAVAALPFMHGWIQSRSQSFSSVEKGVRYVVRAGHVRNVNSARLSVPRQLVHLPEKSRWVWRTDLESTEHYWHGWYEGLSKLFLSVPVPKMLVLAGIDRLDRDLTIAQMQGKFQNIVIPGAGHVVQEDRPQQTADVILNFLRRNLFIDSEEEDRCSPAVVFQQRSIRNV